MGMRPFTSPRQAAPLPLFVVGCLRLPRSGTATTGRLAFVIQTVAPPFLQINRLRKYLENRPNKDSLDPTTGIAVNCAVAFDLKGPEIRTGKLSALGGQVAMQAGETVILSTDPEIRESGKLGEFPEVRMSRCWCLLQYPSGADPMLEVQVYVDYANLSQVVHVGSQVYIDDGLLRLDVMAVAGGRLECIAHNTGVIGEKKGVNLPGAILDLPAVSEKDKQDICMAAEVKRPFAVQSGGSGSVGLLRLIVALLCSSRWMRTSYLPALCARPNMCMQ